MNDLHSMELLAGQYADSHAMLAESVERLNAEIEEFKRRRLPQIRRHVRATAGCRDKLRAAIESAPALFSRPRTRVLAGVKVGYAKQRGKVMIDDEAAVIGRIRKLLPAAQAQLLVRVRESVHKPAVYDLVAADLKRLGIRIADDEDVVVIRSTDSDVDKLVEALLIEAERLDNAGQP